MLRIDKNSKWVEPKKFDYDKFYMPTPGMLGTEYVGSDRYAVICISVDSPKRISLVRWYDCPEDSVDIKNHAKVTFDKDGCMFYNIENIDLTHHSFSKIEKWSLRTNKNGKQSWHEMGSSGKSSSIHWGIASQYRDLDF